MAPARTSFASACVGTPKPGTSNYVAERGGRNDEMHIVIVDDAGTLTGIRGNILEKHIALSKATDAVSEANAPQKTWYKSYLAIHCREPRPCDWSRIAIIDIMLARSLRLYFTTLIGVISRPLSTSGSYHTSVDDVGIALNL